MSSVVTPDQLISPIPSPFPLMMELLRADPAVSQVATSGVFAEKLPRSVVGAMPVPCILLMMSGGRPAAEEAPLWRYRIRVNCYGGPDTLKQSNTTISHHLALAVIRALDNKGPVTNQETVISRIVCSAGPIEMRDTGMNGAILQAVYFMVFAPLVPVPGGAT